MDWETTLQLVWGGNSVQMYLIALGAFVLTTILLKIFKRIVIVKLEEFSKKTKNDVDDLMIEVMNGIGWPFYVLVSLYSAIFFLAVPGIVSTIMSYVVMVTVVFYVLKAMHIIIDYGAKKVIEKRREKSGDTSIITFLTSLLKGMLWGIAIVILLQNVGFNVGGLLAGMGIGGIAIAFALQNILTDIFASFTIYFDKPFKIGDYIVVGDDSGIVKKIGIKTTRLQTLQGQELIISNRELTETRVHNYKRMRERRIVFHFGIEYDTPTKKMREIPKLIADICKKTKDVELDRVHFTDFGDFSLNYEVVYYVKTNDFERYRDIQQEMNLEIKTRFEKKKIGMAFPTQTLFVKKVK